MAKARAAYDQAWNKAERAIKLAEQVNAKIINPAIYELRYAGRRIVESDEALAAGDLPKALGLLSDAHFDCSRARHDAIDAATSKMVGDIHLAITKLGAPAVMAAFPEVSKLLGDLGETRDLIAVSREQRENRDLVYASIENDELPELVKRYRAFVASEALMKSYVRRARGEVIFLRATTVGSLALAALAWLLPFGGGDSNSGDAPVPVTEIETIDPVGPISLPEGP